MTTTKLRKLEGKYPRVLNAGILASHHIIIININNNGSASYFVLNVVK
jgi:hypothetical protein